MKKVFRAREWCGYRIEEITVIKETKERYYFEKKQGIGTVKEFCPKSECFNSREDAEAFLEITRKEKHDAIIRKAEKELSRPITFYAEGEE